MTQYASPSNLLSRYDARLIGDLASDNNVPVSLPALLTNQRVLDALADASATIDAAVRKGNRYTPAQMAALESSAAQLVMRLACDQALIFLKRCRGKFSEKDESLAKEVEQRMKALRDGDDYLMLATQSEAAASTIELAGPCLITVGNPGPLYTIVDATRNYYPQMRGRRTGRNCGSGSGCGCE